MISKLIIDKLNKLEHKRTVAPGSGDGEHPMPLCLQDWVGDLIDYHLFICTPRIMRQMFDIIPHIPYMKEVKPIEKRLEGSLATGFQFWYPAPKIITFALGEGLHNEYWATNVQVTGVDMITAEPILVVDLETTPHHKIGYTSDC